MENNLCKDNRSIVGIDKNKISKFFSSSNQTILVRINFNRLSLKCGFKGIDRSYKVDNVKFKKYKFEQDVNTDE
jgi:hypothetical protein